MKKLYKVALTESEEGHTMYLVYDCLQSLVTQPLKYFSNKRKAEAEARKLNAEQRKQDA